MQPMFSTLPCMAAHCSPSSPSQVVLTSSLSFLMRLRIRTRTEEPCKPDHLPHKPISSFFSLTSLSLRSKPFFFSILELNVSLPFLLRRRQHGRSRKGAELELDSTGDLHLFNGDAAFGSLKAFGESVETACSLRSRARAAALSSKQHARPHGVGAGGAILTVLAPAAMAPLPGSSLLKMMPRWII